MTKHVVIVGGGYTGTCAAIQLSRHAQQPCEISVVEQRTVVGRGLAYSAMEPDHRLNAPDMVHFVTPEDQEALRHWFEEQGGPTYDGQADPGDDVLFIRRRDFGKFLGEQFAAYQASNPSSSTIAHVQDTARDIEKTDSGFRVILNQNRALDADLIIVATSNERPAIPAALQSVAKHPAFLTDPWDGTAMDRIPNSARLLIVGTALTAADVIVSRLRRGQSGRITALSRRGLKSTRRAITPGTYSNPFWERITSETSIFSEKHGVQTRLIDLLQSIRADICEAEANGLPWQGPFDDLRDSVWQIWPALPLVEKRRFMRHLRIWYDVHRFRLPPQLERPLDDAMASGQLRYVTAHLDSARPDGKSISVTFRQGQSTKTRIFDATINCTGPDPRPDRTNNPFLRALVTRGLARPSPVGIGFDVDDNCTLVNDRGQCDPWLRAFGPLTLGQFGDPQGTPFILRHICRTMPQIVGLLASR